MNNERSIKGGIFGFIGVVLLNLKFAVRCINDILKALVDFRDNKDVGNLETKLLEHYDWLSYIYSILSKKIKSIEGPYRDMLFCQNKVLNRLCLGYSRDKFEALFQRQEELNILYGQPLSQLHTDLNSSKSEVRIKAGIIIDDLLKAMSSEIEELRNCTAWKHWCSEAKEGRRYEILDLNNAKLEVIDMLHFWITLAQAVGLTAEQAFDLYWSKSNVNIKRQTKGYSFFEKEKFNDEVIIPD